MARECEYHKCKKRVRWVVVEMDIHNHFCDGREEPVDVREAYFFCGEHKQKTKNIFVFPFNEAIPIYGKGWLSD